MAVKEFSTIIQLRRDTAANYETIKDSYIPRKGEIVLVDTASDKGLRAKVGDGASTYAQLGFTDEHVYESLENKVIRGYLMNGTFYTDSTYQVECAKLINTIYIDANTKVIYTYDGSSFTSVNDTLPTASDVQAGISKLYNTPGQNSDGSISQKCVTDGVNSIKFVVSEDVQECLELDLPWD